MVGDLYNDPRYSNKRDTAFSLFYMAINLGSMYAPGAAIALKEHGTQRCRIHHVGSNGRHCVQLVS